MKKVGIFIALALSLPAWAQSGPDPQHRLLGSLSGGWTVRQSLWMEPGKPPKIDTGIAKFEMILNGRHLRQVLHIDDGTHFEALGHFGYDTASKTFFSTWMDVNFSGLVLARGDFDEAAKAMILRGSMEEEGVSVPVREVLTVTDRDHLRYEFFETREGVEALVVRLDYTRAG